MAGFSSCGSYQRFKRVVCSELRYVRPPDIDEFLEAISVTARKREQEIKAGTFLWRAQLGHGWRISDSSPEMEVLVWCAHPPERMTPRADRALEGRASPKGIPVLYLATQPDAAMLEVRPWLGSSVSIARFEAKRDLRVIDCSQGSARAPLWPRYYPEEPPLPSASIPFGPTSI
jgi:hypothetical protein